MKTKIIKASKSSTAQQSRVKTGRYTPPSNRSKKRSSKWLLALVLGTLGVGALLIIVNFLAILPGGESSWYLLVGILLLAVGFAAATKYK